MATALTRCTLKGLPWGERNKRTVRERLTRDRQVTGGPLADVKSTSATAAMVAGAKTRWISERTIGDCKDLSSSSDDAQTAIGASSDAPVGHAAVLTGPSGRTTRYGRVIIAAAVGVDVKIFISPRLGMPPMTTSTPGTRPTAIATITKGYGSKRQKVAQQRLNSMTSPDQVNVYSPLSGGERKHTKHNNSSCHGDEALADRPSLTFWGKQRHRNGGPIRARNRTRSTNVSFGDYVDIFHTTALPMPSTSE